jgi:DUF438 domain-containing protein
MVDRRRENSIHQGERKVSFKTDSFEEKWVPSIVDRIPMAVTIFDLKGDLLYFNDTAPRIINRKPEHLGRDIRLCHQKPQSVVRINGMIQEFQQGRRDPISYEARPYGKTLLITVSPLEVEGRLVGCVHTAIPKP